MLGAVEVCARWGGHPTKLSMAHKCSLLAAVAVAIKGDMPGCCLHARGWVHAVLLLPFRAWGRRQQLLRLACSCPCSGIPWLSVGDGCACCLQQPAGARGPGEGRHMWFRFVPESVFVLSTSSHRDRARGSGFLASPAFSELSYTCTWMVADMDGWWHCASLCKCSLWPTDRLWWQATQRVQPMSSVASGRMWCCVVEVVLPHAGPRLILYM